MKVIIDQETDLECPNEHRWRARFIVFELGGKGSKMRALKPFTAFGIVPDEAKLCPKCKTEWSKTVLEGMTWFNQMEKNDLSVG